MADDEIVCADCGMSLALARRTVAVQTAQGVVPPGGLLDEFASEPESGESGRDVTLWRLAVIVCVTC